MAVTFGANATDRLALASCPTITALTITFFGKFTSGTSNRAALVNLVNAANNDQLVFQSAGGFVQVDYWNGGTLTHTAAVAANTWYAFAITISGTSVTIYQMLAAGGAVTSSNDPSLVSGLTPTQIQLLRNVLYNNDRDGSIAAVNVFSVVKTQDQIRQIWARQKNSDGVGAYASWMCNSPSTDINDELGARPLTKTGTSTYDATLPVRWGASSAEELVSGAAPAAAPAITPPVFPDVARRVSLPASQQLASAFSPLPIPPPVAPTYGWAPLFPDVAGRLALGAAQHQAAALSPTQIAPSQVLGWDPCFPARTARTFVAASAALAFAGPSLAWQLQPGVAFPDATRGAARSQPAGFAAPLVPERTSPLASAIFPDGTRRLALHASQHLAVTSLSPQPERTSVFADATFPSSTTRLALAASQQQALAYVQVPSIPALTPPVFPDATRATRLPTAQHVAAVLGATPTLPTFFASSYPDVVKRLATPQGDGFAMPAALVPFFGGTFPDATARRAGAQHQSFAGLGSPLPDAPLFVGSVFPDRAPRLAVATGSHQAFALGATPILPTFFAPTFPDATRELTLATGEYYVTALSPVPLPNTAAPALAATWFPDVARRLTLATAEHPFAALHPVPITPTFFGSTFPATTTKATLATAEQLATAQSTTPIVPALASTTFPDTTSRRAPQQGQQAPVFVTVPPLAASIFPDAVRATTRPQPSPVAAPVLPPVTFFAGIFPDATSRNAARQAVATAFVQLERTAPLAVSVFPDATPRRAFVTSAHQAFAFGPTPPIPPVVPDFIGAVFPATTSRARFVDAFTTSLPPVFATPVDSVVCFTRSVDVDVSFRREAAETIDVTRATAEALIFVRRLQEC